MSSRSLALVAVSTALIALSGCPSRESVPNPTSYTDATVLDSGGPPPKVVLLVGDGMGPGQIAAASWYRYGAASGLAMQELPIRGKISTSSPSGITDSAASATAMATGAFTWNGRVAIDQDRIHLQTLVELAKEYGMATGLVSNTRIAHATPASFASHVQSRGQYQDIAEQIAALRPDVLMGGGRADFEMRGDERNLSNELEDNGFRVVHTASELERTTPSDSPRLLGLFADYHLSYRVERGDDEDVPLLKDMTRAALQRLDADPQGFFLVVEGGRIDHAGHENNIDRLIAETLAFDDTVADVVQWAGGRDDVTIVVTADHETGGLNVHSGSVGERPQISWRWGSHTNTLVDVFAHGPGTQRFDGQVRDHRWVHSAIAGLIRNQPSEPPRHIIADGRLGDLLGPSSVQTIEEAGPGGARLQRLLLDTNERGLGIGLEGLFPWESGATLILIDVDYGAGTGIRSLTELTDRVGNVDALLGTASIPAITNEAFGIDLAFVTQDGLEPKFEQRPDNAGLRGLRGDSGDLLALPVATNFSDHARITMPGSEVRQGQGFELFIRWQELYGSPEPPMGARLAVWALQLDEHGAATNQSLPAWRDFGENDSPVPLQITP